MAEREKPTNKQYPVDSARRADFKIQLLILTIYSMDQVSTAENKVNKKRKVFQQYHQEHDVPDAADPSFDIDGKIKIQKRWPFLLWLYLKSLGLYNDGMEAVFRKVTSSESGPLVTVRRCAICKNYGHEQFTTKFSFQMHQCDVCESFLWDHEGRVSYITDDDIGASRLNHRRSFVVSNVWLFLLISATISLITFALLRYSNGTEDLIETVSKVCIQGLLTIPVFSTICCNLNSAFPDWAPGKWATVLSPTFLVQRLRCVNMRKTRMAGYILFFTSIFFICLQCAFITQDLFAYGKERKYFNIIEYFMIFASIFNFAGLTYVAYLLRRSYEKEVRLVCYFIKDHIDIVDVCRQRLAEAFDTFHLFREFTSGWMSMNVLFGVVSFLLEIHVWITATKSMPYFRYERLVFLLACFIFPILAIGNVSVDYLWNRLVRQISRQRTAEKEFNWDKIMQFLQEQRPGNRPWQSVMAFILSIIAVFAAIQFRILSSKAINAATNFNTVNVTEIFY